MQPESSQATEEVCSSVSVGGPSPGSIGTLTSEACIFEATAPKVGNVHRHASFADMAFEDFEKSARAIGPVFEKADQDPLGHLILEGVKATRNVVNVNTNLGTILLFGPISKGLARIFKEGKTGEISWDSFEAKLEFHLKDVLSELSPADTLQVYEAIALARPGGLGKVDQMDIHDQPPASLLDAMRAAHERDQIAAEYVYGFPLSRFVASQLLNSRSSGLDWDEAICRIQVRLLAEQGDSLIARKCSLEVHRIVKGMAGELWEVISHSPHTSSDGSSIMGSPLRQKLDQYLRDDGHRRNPGSTADIIAAGLLIALGYLSFTNSIPSILFKVSEES